MSNPPELEGIPDGIGWEEAVYNLIYLLEVCGGFWLRDSRSLSDQMARLPVNLKEKTTGKALENEQEVLSDVIRNLATIYNCPKANLSEIRQIQMNDVLHVAITESNKRKKTIPIEIESRNRAAENVRRILGNANFADDEANGPKATVVPPREQATDAIGISAIPKNFSLTFEPGSFVCREHRETLSGKPLQVLKALWESQKKTLTLGALQDKVWTDAVIGQETIRSAVSTARKALARAYAACGIEKPETASRSWPLSLVDRGHGSTAWRLDVP